MHKERNIIHLGKNVVCSVNAHWAFYMKTAFIYPPSWEVVRFSNLCHSCSTSTLPTNKGKSNQLNLDINQLWQNTSQKALINGSHKIYITYDIENVCSILFNIFNFTHKSVFTWHFKYQGQYVWKQHSSANK